MLLIISLVFIGVFIVFVLLMAATGTGESPQVKQRLEALTAAAVSSRPQFEDEVADIRKQELLSALPWLNRWLIKLDLAPQLRLLLYQANVKWTVGGLVLMSVSAWVFSGSLIYWRTDAGVPAICFSAIFFLVPGYYVTRKRSARFNAFEQKLPETLDTMVSAIRAGQSLITAVSTVARDASEPIRGEFRKCFDEMSYGVELRTAMLNLSTRVPLADVRMVVAAILIQKESGGNLTEVLENVAHIIRERFRLKRQIRVHTAQGRLTGWILSILPVFLGLALYLINPENMSVLWTKPIGVKMLYTAAVMTIIGGLVIRKIVKIRI
jgi:tight adherence protein B